MIKIDPYMNVDAGTMAPTEHGEVFALDDGGEVDLDLGNYERYLNITLTREHNITTGKIYKHAGACIWGKQSRLSRILWMQSQTG